MAYSYRNWYIHPADRTCNHPGSGNVFTDLGPPEAALLLGVPQPKVSPVENYRLDGFSVEKLMDFIIALGRDVEIVVWPVRGDAEARVSVLDAV